MYLPPILHPFHPSFHIPLTFPPFPKNSPLHSRPLLQHHRIRPRPLRLLPPRHLPPLSPRGSQILSPVRAVCDFAPLDAGVENEFAAADTTPCEGGDAEE